MDRGGTLAYWARSVGLRTAVTGHPTATQERPVVKAIDFDHLAGLCRWASDRASDAHRRMAGDSAFGKIVLYGDLNCIAAPDVRRNAL